MDLENHIKSALRRKTPSPDFAARVMSAIDRERAAGPYRPAGNPFLRRRLWRAVAAAAVFTALLGGWTARQIAERRAGERARDEVMVALHIAGSKVHYAQTQVYEIGSKR